MICKLCERDFPKLVKSHIIPKSLYGEMLSPANGTPRIMSTNTFRASPRSPAGEYDSGILCSSCEASIGLLDNYAHRLLKAETPERVFDSGQHICDIYRGIDKDKLRLFVLSLAWRAHATSRPAFGPVDLGKFESQACTALISGKPNQAPNFDAVFSRFDNDDTAFLFPRSDRICGVNGYSFWFPGWRIWIKVDSREVPDPFDECALLRREMLVVLRREFSTSPEKRALVKVVQASARAKHP